MALTKADLDTEIAAFKTDLDAGSYQAARVHLINAEAILQSLPVTEHVHWRGTLDRLFDHLDRAERQASGNAGRTITFWHLRNKRHSTTS